MKINHFELIEKQKVSLWLKLLKVLTGLDLENSLKLFQRTLFYGISPQVIHLMFELKFKVIELEDCYLYYTERFFIRVNHKNELYFSITLFQNEANGVYV